MDKFLKHNLKYFIIICVMLVASTSIVTYYVTKGNTNQMVRPVDDEIADTLSEPEPVYLYGLNVDSFVVFENEIKRNENLSDILLDYGLEYADIYELATKSKGIFNVRKIRRGNKYAMFCSKDSLTSLKIMVYEIDNTDYVVFDLRDSLRIYRDQKEITTKRTTASGVIESSLYETLQDNGINPMVAVEMSEVFAWQIDFYRLQKGDRFKVIFYEEFVGDHSIGVKEIEAAYFHHFDNDYYGIYFEQDSIGDYYDEKGKSLRKAFLKTPLEFGRLTSRFTYRRYHPVQKRWKPHLGTDYAAPYGTPIRATGAGTVIKATYSKYNGNYVKIKHNGTYTTQYLHMSKRARGIKPGVRVKQGQTIGYVGSTGLATGPHVCYRFWKNGVQVDARKEKFPSSKPVKEKYIKAYNKVLRKELKALDKIRYKGPKFNEKIDAISFNN